MLDIFQMELPVSPTRVRLLGEAKSSIEDESPLTLPRSPSTQPSAHLLLKVAPVLPELLVEVLPINPVYKTISIRGNKEDGVAVARAVDEEASRKLSCVNKMMGLPLRTLCVGEENQQRANRAIRKLAALGKRFV